MTITEVPSPIDLRRMSDALEWEKKAMERPFREEFFAAITNELKKHDAAQLEILELGSGPGFLAEHIMTRLLSARMTLLDFSSAMHNKQLYMTLDEQRSSLRDAGYTVSDILIKGGRALYHAC